MINDLKLFRTKIDEIKVEKKLLTKQLEAKQELLDKATVYGVDALEARAIIQSVAESTQKCMIQYFTSLITPLIQAIWMDDRSFEMDFVQKRNVTECEIWIDKDGNKADLFQASGGGLRNIVSIGCRLAFWFLEKKSRPIMFMDEPFSALNSSEYQQRISETLDELSKRMGMQFLIITDQPDITGDKLFKMTNGKVKVIE